MMEAVYSSETLLITRLHSAIIQTVALLNYGADSRSDICLGLYSESSRFESGPCFVLAWLKVLVLFLRLFCKRKGSWPALECKITVSFQIFISFSFVIIFCQVQRPVL
jgi:hypothetical protein